MRLSTEQKPKADKTPTFALVLGNVQCTTCLSHYYLKINLLCKLVQVLYLHKSASQGEDKISTLLIKLFKAYKKLPITYQLFKCIYPFVCYLWS